MSTILPGLQNQIEAIAGRLKLNTQPGGITGSGPAPKSYRVLFSGSPDIAKTFASDLGSQTNKEVHTVNLATPPPRYIGETEKNLDRVFTDAGQTNSILFFDEADSLFAKRSEVKDPHDRYNIQETPDLLQRIDQYEGVVIMATTNADDIDPQFLSHFNTILRNPGNP
jgi:SpoVK/Ycf46/Vps4 family AAA+-type ATPase